jgi:hypothetical protein
MAPFGKQQEILDFLSTTNPEELLGKPPAHVSSRRRSLISNEESACGKYDQISTENALVLSDPADFRIVGNLSFGGVLPACP